MMLNQTKRMLRLSTSILWIHKDLCSNVCIITCSAFDSPSPIHTHRVQVKVITCVLHLWQVINSSNNSCNTITHNIWTSIGKSSSKNDALTTERSRPEGLRVQWSVACSAGAGTAPAGSIHRCHWGWLFSFWCGPLQGLSCVDLSAVCLGPWSYQWWGCCSICVFRLFLMLAQSRLSVQSLYRLCMFINSRH